MNGTCGIDQDRQLTHRDREGTVIIAPLQGARRESHSNVGFHPTLLNLSPLGTMLEMLQPNLLHQNHRIDLTQGVEGGVLGGGVYFYYGEGFAAFFLAA